MYALLGVERERRKWGAGGGGGGMSQNSKPSPLLIHVHNHLLHSLPPLVSLRKVVRSHGPLSLSAGRKHGHTKINKEED